MSGNKELAGLLAVSMAVSAMCGEPFSDMVFRLPKSKGRPGTLVRCRVCGGGGTLYNDGDGKICAKCRAKVDGEE